MYNPFNERICKQCPFKGKVFETKVGTVGIKYIDCQRDNKDVQEDFIRTNKEESLLLWAKQSEFFYIVYTLMLVECDESAYQDTPST